ncbi:Chaperone protein DnaJ [Diplonema papillatum]|nr:Chaperone protein DnaJ [Diplonema papillatum]
MTLADSHHYEVLELPSTASLADVKKAYHKLAKETHPDRHNGNAERFKLIGEAYELLKEKAKHLPAIDIVDADSDAETDPADEAAGFTRTRRANTRATAPPPPGSQSPNKPVKRSPGMRPRRGSPSHSASKNEPLKPAHFCKTEYIACCLVLLLLVLVASSGSASSTSFRSYFSRPKTSIVVPDFVADPNLDPAHATTPSVMISGACPEAAGAVDGKYTQMGTLLGRPWYKEKDTGSMIYYDTSCDGSFQPPPGWFLVEKAEADRIAAPSSGMGCATLARIAWDGTQLPFGEEEWEIACGDSKSSIVTLTFTRI